MRATGRDVEVPMDDADRIARALGGERRGEWRKVHCPVPGHGRGRGDVNPSLLIRQGDKAAVVRCAAGCDSRDVIAELKRRGLWNGGADARPLDPTERERQRHEGEARAAQRARKEAWMRKRALEIFHEA